MDLYVGLSLLTYFVVNLSLSTSNKLVLEQFPTPWLLTSVHATCTFIGCLLFLKAGYFKMKSLTKQENTTLAIFSCLFTINIAMSNLSLSQVSLAFHQIARSTGPIFTVLAYRCLYKKQYQISTYLAVVAMSVGIGMVTYGDYHFTTMGFLLTFLGLILATVKTIATNQLMTGNLKLHPLEVLLRLSPLAAVQSLISAFLAGEFQTLSLVSTATITRQSASWVLFNGTLAFAQNFVSFHTNKIAGALTVTMCANLKQAFTVMVAVHIFNTHVGHLFIIGMVIVLLSAATYSWTLMGDKNNANLQRVENLHEKSGLIQFLHKRTVSAGLERGVQVPLRLVDNKDLP